MIRPDGIKEFADAMVGIISKGTYTIGGTTKDIPIHSTKIDGDTFHVNLYLDDTVVGNVTNTGLYSYKGTLLADRPDYISKPEDKGLLIVYKFKLSEVTP